jgi:hypothetical protein
VPEQSALVAHWTHPLERQWGVDVGQFMSLTHCTQPGGLFGDVQTTGGGAPASAPLLLPLAPLLPPSLPGLPPEELPPEPLPAPELLPPPGPEPLLPPIASGALASGEALPDVPPHCASTSGDAEAATNATIPIDRRYALHRTVLIGASHLRCRNGSRHKQLTRGRDYRATTK